MVLLLDSLSVNSMEQLLPLSDNDTVDMLTGSTVPGVQYTFMDRKSSYVRTTLPSFIVHG